jgi:hypothetical protein
LFACGPPVAEAREVVEAVVEVVVEVVVVV